MLFELTALTASAAGAGENAGSTAYVNSFVPLLAAGATDPTTAAQAISAASSAALVFMRAIVFSVGGKWPTGASGAISVARNQLRPGNKISALALADAGSFRFEDEVFNSCVRQCDQKVDVPADRIHRMNENIGIPLRIQCAWIRMRPMRGRRAARPDGACFTCGFVAKRDDQVHRRRGCRGELAPAFAAQPLCGNTSLLKDLQGTWVRLAIRCRSAAGGVGVEPLASQLVEECLSHEASGGVAVADEQHIGGVA
ncbi:hypothetical protein D9M68_665670 [compost metagenome]